jgi:hypothetical protein
LVCVDVGHCFEAARGLIVVKAAAIFQNSRIEQSPPAMRTPDELHCDFCIGLIQ